MVLKFGMKVEFVHAIAYNVLMLVSITLTLLQGHSGSVEGGGESVLNHLDS